MNHEMESWSRTGVKHSEPCGCQFEQRIEPGSDYHEGWLQIARCAEHREAS